MILRFAKSPSSKQEKCWSSLLKTILNFRLWATCLADRIGRASKHGTGGIIGLPTQKNTTRIHQLWLSDQGKKYSDLCVKLRDLLSEMASCLDTAMKIDEKLGEFFQLGTEIWVEIEKEDGHGY